MVERRPVALRISLTQQCQFRCMYCRPSGGHTSARSENHDPSVWIQRVADIHRAVGVSKVRLTGGEPLLYKGVETLIAGLRELGIDDVAMTTNAELLGRRARALAEAGLTRVNISLDSIDPERFTAMTGRRLEPVVEGIRAAVEAGLPVKLNCVVLRGKNDDTVVDLLRFATNEGVQLRYLELMPIGPASHRFEELYVSGTEVVQRLQDAGVALTPVLYEAGETAREYVATWSDGRQVTCGFILPTSKPFCEGCRRLRVAPDGAILGCLAQPDRFEVNLDASTDENERIAATREVVQRALAVKQRTQNYEEQAPMLAVGG